jgi:hypothetical protein
MLTFEHSSGAESFGFLNPVEWFVPVRSSAFAVAPSPSSCHSLVVTDLGDSFPLRERPARLVQPEESSAARVLAGSGAASVPLHGPEFAIVVAGVAALFIWPRKAKRLLRKIVEGPKLF